jgi:hypothetical protein
MRSATAAAVVAALGVADAQASPSDEVIDAAVIFARGASLYQVDARGRGETEIAQLPAKVTVRALRSDAAGSVLLADLGGRWAWMPLDGSARALTDLPCGEGPAQLAQGGAAVVCRSTAAPDQSVVIALPSGRATPLPVPCAGARLFGAGAETGVVWTDPAGVWTAPIREPGKRLRVAPDPPLRGFLASPDATHAIAVYADRAYTDARHVAPAEVLMTLQLDRIGARRKAIRDGVALEWSHDSQWVLVQDGPSACIMRAAGGQYKCWRGYTAASISPDGRFALVLGNRDGSRRQKPAKQDKPKPEKSKRGKKSADRPATRAADVKAWDDPDAKPWDKLEAPSNEPESAEPAPPPIDDDNSVPVPGGPLSLFRARLEGAFTDRPSLLVKNLDGAAVWIPRAP